MSTVLNHLKISLIPQIKRVRVVCFIRESSDDMRALSGVEAGRSTTGDWLSLQFNSVQSC